MCIRDRIYEDEIKIEQRISKCPEIIIKFNNNISVAALVDIGSAINGLYEEWFNQNKQYLESYEELSMLNTLIISAVGSKSKLIRKQILCEIYINEVKMDCVI